MFILIIFFIYLYLSSYEGFVTYNRCNQNPLGKLMLKIFKKHNITKNEEETKGDIYIPCGYNNVEKELKMLSLHNHSKYIFGISGCDKIVSKNNLWFILFEQYGREKSSQIMPESYLAYDNHDLYLFKTKYKKGDIYILKKNLQRKEGLLLSKDFNEIINCNKDGYKVIQTYITDTFLINKRKINLRIYLLVTCSNGKISGWVHKNGKCIYTNKDYNDDELDFEKNITSYNLDMSIYEKNPFTLEELKLHLKYMGYNNSNKLFETIDSHINKTLSAADKYLCKLSDIKKKPTFQLFGLDFVIKSDLHPMLLEINKGPDMNPKNKEDEELKTRVLEDIFRTIGIIEDNIKPDFRKIY